MIVIPIVTGSLGMIPKDLERIWKSYKSKDETMAAKFQYCWYWLEFLEEPWKLDESCFLSDTIERLSSSENS